MLPVAVDQSYGGNALCYVLPVFSHNGADGSESNSHIFRQVRQVAETDA